AVELDPNNQQYKDSLKQAQDKLQQQRRAASAPSGAGAAGGQQQMPDLSALACMLGGGAGGAGGLGALLQNPAMMQMCVALARMLVEGGKASLTDCSHLFIFLGLFLLAGRNK